MSICWYIAALVLLHSCTTGVGMHHGIVGGKLSAAHSRPYMVYIRDMQRKELTCGGVLVREDFVLTAAHCKAEHLKVYLGVDDTKHLTDGIAVTQCPHPDFKNTPGYDIMLLKLQNPIHLNKIVKTIALPKTTDNEIPNNCMVMGWGSDNFDFRSLPIALKEVNVTLIESDTCGVFDTICSKGSAGPSRGDSGGPLVCGDVTQGIVSFNTKESDDNYEARYTRISLYLDWIHHVMKTAPQYQSCKG